MARWRRRVCAEDARREAGIYSWGAVEAQSATRESVAAGPVAVSGAGGPPRHGTGRRDRRAGRTCIGIARSVVLYCAQQRRPPLVLASAGGYPRGRGVPARAGTTRVLGGGSGWHPPAGPLLVTPPARAPPWRHPCGCGRARARGRGRGARGSRQRRRPRGRLASFRARTRPGVGTAPLPCTRADAAHGGAGDALLTY